MKEMNAFVILHLITNQMQPIYMCFHIQLDGLFICNGIERLVGYDIGSHISEKGNERTLMMKLKATEELRLAFFLLVCNGEMRLS